MPVGRRQYFGTLAIHISSNSCRYRRAMGGWLKPATPSQLVACARYTMARAVGDQHAAGARGELRIRRCGSRCARQPAAHGEPACVAKCRRIGRCVSSAHLGEAVAEQEALDEFEEGRLVVELRLEVRREDRHQALRAGDGAAGGLRARPRAWSAPAAARARRPRGSPRPSTVDGAAGASCNLPAKIVLRSAPWRRC